MNTKRLLLYVILSIAASACHSSRQATDAGNTTNTVQATAAPSTPQVAKPTEQPAVLQKANERLEVK